MDFPWFPILLILGLLGLLGFAAYEVGKDHDRLVAQCIADGRKEYECRAMLDSHTQVVPVATPVYVGR